jgi:ectoine hydroxylase-related dioxygenase (phytanoyl-CoA dioxygenase family)
MLTPAQIQHYRDHGYLIAGGIFSTAELDEMEAAFDRIVEQRLKKRAPVEVLWAGDWQKQLPKQTPLVHTHDVQAYSAAWSRAILHPRFTEAMADLIGPNVQLHHTKLMQKPPERGAAFPMHQDYPYFPHARHTMTACVVHLRDTPVEAGCLRVVPGSHKLGPLETYRQPDGGPQTEYLDPAVYPIEKGTPCPANRGEVVFFNYLTIHGSGLNTSSGLRKTVLVEVRDAADRETGPAHVSHARGLMLRGENPLEAGHTAEGTAEEQWQKAAG